ncbi:hypothetical protein PoB_001981600 [Plakobranchus ocellatus]|uniref:Uncharacterized protein n=1 Tax=Plakobranchus ocellatus TaxID=259542 RepID=A0AAV3ZF99_9GAST|nr:hypothetical protein PoB_001981600 [Plakobranchus ocellatus]
MSAQDNVKTGFNPSPITSQVFQYGGEISAAGAGCEGKRMPSVSPFPSPKWLLSVYVAVVFSDLEELKSAITSTLGKILKMDSTRGVTKKLASSGSRTAAW